MKQAAIQQAVFDRLSTLPCPRYDNVPQGSAFPYVVIGDDTSNQWDTDDSTGTETTCTIHVWSRQPGRKEVKDLMQLIYDRLHRSNFPIAGAVLIECQAEFQESFMDPDGITRHGVIRFRLTVDFV
jgi:hypothetical protein